MEIQFISHACVKVRCGGKAILMDPWLISRAFNDSWELMPAPDVQPEDFSDIDFLWISHQHPDHFNLPTLRAFSTEFKQKVTVLYQQRTEKRIFSTMRHLGFKNFVSLPHRHIITLEGIDFYCFLASLGDSCLGIRHAGEIVFNINDAELDITEIRKVKRDLGAPTTILNQFSIAGYGGSVDRSQEFITTAKHKLRYMSRIHQELSARVTIPFASFVYFCREDNADLNAYVNHPATVSEYMRQQGCQCLFLKPNQSYIVNDNADLNATNTAAVDYYTGYFANISQQPIYPSDSFTLDELEKAYGYFYKRMCSHYPSIVRFFVGNLTCYLDDLGQAIRMSLRKRSFEKISLARNECDIAVNMQPLFYSLKFPWGFETLGVSGRHQVFKLFRWKLWKRISILENNEFYLTGTDAFSSQNFNFMWEHLRGAIIRNFARWNEA